MFVRRFADAPTRNAGDLVSHVLLQRGDTDSALTMTWVRVPPGAGQAPHSHDPEQCYVIVRGTGRMLVGTEEQDVGPGDLVRVPPGVVHGIENAGTELLEYVSAATPAFAVTDHYAEPD
jgi:mannose-6-phosphate isomerase-like protein (cupin superfamily)